MRCCIKGEVFVVLMIEVLGGEMNFSKGSFNVKFNVLMFLLVSYFVNDVLVFEQLLYWVLLDELLFIMNEKFWCCNCSVDCVLVKCFIEECIVVVEQSVQILFCMVCEVGYDFVNWIQYDVYVGWGVFYFMWVMIL